MGDGGGAACTELGKWRGCPRVLVVGGGCCGFWASEALGDVGVSRLMALLWAEGIAAQRLVQRSRERSGERDSKRARDHRGEIMSSRDRSRSFISGRRGNMIVGVRM